MKKRLGEFVEKGEAWCELHVGARADVAAAKKRLAGALTLSDEPMAQAKPLVYRAID